MRFFFRILCVTLLFAVVASAQQAVQFFSATSSRAAIPSPGEAHLQSTPSGALFYNSTFAHGYRHGYDEGFHVGDLDIQMGRDPQNVEKTSEFRHDVQGFKTAFGDKDSFRHGYRQGFRIGYREAVSGLPFRGRQRTESAAKGLSAFLQNEARSSFDRGFSGGYLMASKVPKPPQVPIEYAEQYCHRTEAAEQQHAGEYCSGYSRGYLLGVSDSSTTDKDAVVSAHHSK